MGQWTAQEGRKRAQAVMPNKFLRHLALISFARPFPFIPSGPSSNRLRSAAILVRRTSRYPRSALHSMCLMSRLHGRSWVVIALSGLNHLGPSFL